MTKYSEEKKPNGFLLALSDIWLLLEKNFRIQLRKKVASIFEILVPCMLIFLLAILRATNSDVQVVQNVTLFEPFEVNQFSVLSNAQDTGKFQILYTPPQAKNIMLQLLVQLNKRNYFTAEPFPDVKSLEAFYKQNYSNTDPIIFCAVVFNQFDAKDRLDFELRFPSIPRYYKEHSSKAKVRKTWQTLLISPKIEQPGPRELNQNDGGDPGYAREGFLYIQHQLSLAAANVLYGNVSTDAYDTDELVHFNAQRFPFPPYLNDAFLTVLSFIMPSMIMFSFIYPAVNLAKTLVIEKEKRLKESMKMMGMKEKYHWIAHFIKSLIWSLPTLVGIVVLMHIKLTNNMALLNFSNPMVVFLFLFIYNISNICICFAISSFFSKANLSAIAVGAILFFTFLPFTTTVLQYDKISSTAKIIESLLPNTNMGFGIYIIMMKECRNVAIDWENLNLPGIPKDSLTIAKLMGTSLASSALLLLVTWYMTLAFPGEYGIPLPWYFPFTKRYWFETDDYYDGPIKQNGTANPNIEPDPNNLQAGIQIANLAKTYDGGKTYSVSGLSFNTFNSQITALLGHNGAGKTTTISILVGLFKPTSGTAYLNGHDIRTDIHKIRSSLGICPQFNILFDELTVEEHLIFYCKLKKVNLSKEGMKTEVDSMIRKLDLLDKRNTLSVNLSGGMKRKLSVGIALIGGSQIVILDEPTSGMDVSARRFIWDLLLEEKNRRSIMISTHFMEEADVLGDRIAIMANGQLQCCGSPLFLKKRYGEGYHLTLVKKSAITDTNVLTELIQKSIEGAKLESSVGVEVTYSLPSDDTALFEPLLRQIESDESLNIANYGISVTTMEEVFLKVGDYSKQKITSITDNNNGNSLHREPELAPTNILVKSTGIELWFRQLYALLIKKLIFIIRNPILMVCIFLIPTAIVFVTLQSLRAIPSPTESPMLHMNVDQFDNPMVTYFYDQSSAGFGEAYKGALNNGIENPMMIKGVEMKDIETVYTGLVNVSSTVYNYQLMVSAAFFKNQNQTQELRMLFNDQAYHTPAIAMSLIDEAFIRHQYSKTKFLLRVDNHPLPLTMQENIKESVNQVQKQFQIQQSVLMGTALLACSFAVLAVKERVTKGKHLQRVCGTPMSAYWISYFLIDFIIYLLAMLLLISVLVFSKEAGFYEDQQPAYQILSATMVGFAFIPCVYSLSFLFDTPVNGYARLFMLFTLLGVLTNAADNITGMKDMNLLNVNRVLKPIFALLIPVFNIGKNMALLFTNFQNNQLCNSNEPTTYGNSSITVQKVCELIEDNPALLNTTAVKSILPCCKNLCKEMCLDFQSNYLSLEEPGIGLFLIYSVISSVLYWTLLTLIEYDSFAKFKKLFQRNQVTKPADGQVKDDDVVAEKKRIDLLVQNFGQSDSPLIVNHLVKQYGSFTAVNDISYSIKRGECFGLLGINGAGKTTTFKMITGDEPVSSGDIIINGFSVSKEIGKCLKQIGYCPQFDAMLEDMTGNETIRLYSRLRGIQESDIDQQIRELSQLLYFEQHLNKQVKNYSGGNKRKLSTALALLGNPSVSFLDEPTTGVDPVSRRCLWGAIGKKLEQGCSVVLTSHSMEECEALCSRLIIMVNGQICCIGSPMHLKNKFGNSYTVLIKVSPGEVILSPKHRRNSSTASSRRSRVNSTRSFGNAQEMKRHIETVRQFMEDNFPNCVLKATHNNLLHYVIHKTEQIKCSTIFGTIERAKDLLKIEDYSVCQTNLEQVFLSFARGQREENLSD